MARSASDAPLPPPELAAYILGREDTAGVLEAYVEQGERIAGQLERLLGPDWSWEGKRVLDFGCGSARILRQFLDRADVAELHGAELDAACVDWIARTLSPPLQVVQSPPLAPLPYPDGHFDLIWSIAVYSQLADGWADWVLELRRLLRPGGIAIVSVAGAFDGPRLADEAWDPDRVGMLVLGYGRPWSAGGPMCLHSEWWIRAHWGRALTVERFEERGIEEQDAVVLRRDERPAPTTAQMVAPEPGEPRELTAALHAVELLQRDYATLNAQHDGFARAYAEESRKREADVARIAALEAELGRERERAARTLAARLRGRLRRR